MLRQQVLASPWPLTLAVAFFLALPILAQGEFSAAETRQRVRTEQLAANARVADQAAAVLNAAVVQLRDQVAAIAIRPVTGRSTPLIDALQRGDGPSVQLQLATLQSLLGGEAIAGPRANAIYVADAAGRINYDTNNGLVGKFASGESWWASVTAARPVVVSSVGRPALGVAGPGAGPIFHVAAYIERARADAPAHLVVRMAVTRLASDVLAPIFPSVDELYLIDEQGRLIARRSRLTQDDAWLSDLSTNPVVAAAIASPALSLEGDDPFGRGPRLISSAVLPDVGWRVIAEQSTGALGNEVDANLPQDRALRGLLAGLLLVATFLLARSAGKIVAQRSELAETNRQLAHASEAKSAFLASVSHELRTPMNAILGFTEALLAGVDGPLNDEQKSSLGWVQRGGQDLLGLINEILDLSKIEAGKLVITPEAFDPRELLETVVAQHRSLAAGKGVPITWRDEGMPEQVTLDRQRTRQILVNLIGNAMKFTEHGKVEVVGSGGESGRLWLAVLDSGTGIPADQHEAIFEEFRQVEGTIGGSGLGLPISRRLARLMGGEITVESALGRGSVFRVDLPQDLRVGHEAEIAPLKAGAEKILLAVDDDPSLGPLLEKMLAGRAYRVVAPDPAAAVSEARRLHPNVITLDLLMPERSGADILRELRSDPTTRNIPVISLSVVDAADAPKDVDGHLTKPLKKGQLLRKLDELEKAAAARS